MSISILYDYIHTMSIEITTKENTKVKLFENKDTISETEAKAIQENLTAFQKEFSTNKREIVKGLNTVNQKQLVELYKDPEVKKQLDRLEGNLKNANDQELYTCLLYTSPSPRD